MTTDKPHYLYQLYDQNGGLLYVGLTVNPRRRFREHRSRSPFAQEIDHSRTQVSLMPDRATAYRLEAFLIKRFKPAFNQQSHPDHLRQYCVRGHEYTPATTYYRKGQHGRSCRTCRLEDVQRFYARHGRKVAA